MRYTNELIKTEIEKTNGRQHFLNIFDHMLNANGQPAKELFEADGLHLSKKGYLLWKEILLDHFASGFKIS